MQLLGYEEVLDGMEGCTKERFKGKWNILCGCKREALNRLGWSRSACSCVVLRRLGAVVSL